MPSPSWGKQEPNVTEEMTMGPFDKIRQAAAEHEELVDNGIGKIADLADERTGGEHRDKIDGAAQKLDDLLERDDGKA